jgi:hypothetical protein
MKKIFQLFLIAYQILPAEQNEPDMSHYFKAGQRITDSGKRHVRSRFERITESASGNGGKGNGCDAVLRSQPQHVAVTGGKFAEPPLNPR